MVDIYFDISNIVKFKIVDNQNSFTDKIMGDPFQEYENYRSKNIIEDQDLDFIVNIVDNIERRENVYIVDDSFYINEGYIYTRGSYKIAKWDIEIIESNGICIINIAPNAVARLFISGFFIDFIIQYVLTQKGYSIIHSSAVSKCKRSYLFSGRGGSGKTSIAIRLISSGQGFEYMGDDFILIKDGQSLPYFTPLNLFNYNISPFLFQKFRKIEKLNFKLKGWIFRMTGGYAKLFTKLNPLLVIPNVSLQPSEVSTVTIIIPKNGDTGFDLKSISKSDAIKYIINNLKMDSWFIPTYFIQYSYIYPDGSFSKYWDKYYQNLLLNIPESVRFNLVDVPKTMRWDDVINNLKVGDENE